MTDGPPGTLLSLIKIIIIMMMYMYCMANLAFNKTFIHVLWLYYSTLQLSLECHIYVFWLTCNGPFV